MFEFYLPTLRKEIVVATARAIDRLFAKKKSRRRGRGNETGQDVEAEDEVVRLCRDLMCYYSVKVHVRAVVDVKLIGSPTEHVKQGTAKQTEERPHDATFFLFPR